MARRDIQTVKWYKPEQATPDQRAAISYLVRTGPPYGAAGKRFIWPLDLVTTAGAKQFGYLMARIDTQRFAELGEVWAHLKPVPGLSALCEISVPARKQLPGAPPLGSLLPGHLGGKPDV